MKLNMIIIPLYAIVSLKFRMFFDLDTNEMCVGRGMWAFESMNIISSVVHFHCIVFRVYT